VSPSTATVRGGRPSARRERQRCSTGRRVHLRGRCLGWGPDHATAMKADIPQRCRRRHSRNPCHSLYRQAQRSPHSSYGISPRSPSHGCPTSRARRCTGDQSRRGPQRVQWRGSQYSRLRHRSHRCPCSAAGSSGLESSRGSARSCRTRMSRGGDGEDLEAEFGQMSTPPSGKGNRHDRLGRVQEMKSYVATRRRNVPLTL
jgi:hypothetical protein